MNEKKKLLLIIIAILFIGTLIKAYKYYFTPVNPSEIIVKDTTTNTKKRPTFHKPKIVVHVAGAVHTPGVYKVETGKRVMDIIADEGGGLLPQANRDKVNLAQIPKDGKRINVPFIKNVTKSTRKKKQATTPQQTTQASVININTATAKELEQLNRIGPKTAQKIIDYRTKNRRFNSIEDLKKVSGIGPKTLEINRERIKI